MYLIREMRSHLWLFVEPLIITFTGKHSACARYYTCWRIEVRTLRPFPFDQGMHLSDSSV